MSDYYGILGLDKDCTQDQIKTSFKKLAREHHPDKGGDKERFQEIQKAYETLSDPERRQEYDSPSPFGNHPFGGGGGGFHFNFEDFFGGMRHPGGNGGGGGNNKCADHVYNCRLTLRDIYFGITKTIKISRNRHCESCRKECGQCGGSGMLRKMIQLGPIRQIIQQPCGNCSGSGKISNRNKNCKECEGNGIIPEERVVEIKISRGTKSEQDITIEGWGEQPQRSNTIPGNLIIRVLTTEDHHFKREGLDLVHTVNLSLGESIIGKSIKIPHFSGEFELNTSQFGVINPNRRYTIPDKGLVTEKDQRGNLILCFTISYPDRKLNEEEIKMTKDCLGKIGLV